MELNVNADRGDISVGPILINWTNTWRYNQGKSNRKSWGTLSVAIWAKHNYNPIIELDMGGGIEG